MMDDTISRREAIKVVRASCHWDYPWASKSPNDIMSDAVNALKGLPSAQSEIKTDGDMISRQQTIDALMQEFKRIPTNSIRAKTVVENLPSAQPETNCSEIPNGSDTISRRAAIDAVLKLTYADGAYGYTDAKDLVDSLENLPSAQPEIKTGRWISEQDMTDKLTRLINEFEMIVSDIREKEVDDCVCGLCEYDADHGMDGYANECPGFEKDDCFKLKDEYRKQWMSMKW